jgi:YegS/Rv2252/BmrU family lipid kinase
VRPAVLIYNPTAGRRRQPAMLEALLPELRRSGFAVEVRATAAPGDATRLAAAAAAEGAEAVFVLGGDGTVREAAAALHGGDTPLAILPGGTTNVLAHALGLQADPLAAARAHGAHPVRRVDVGLCGGRPFLMMASGGFDAFLLRHLDPDWKLRLGKAGIALQGLFHLPRYRFPHLVLSVDGEEQRVGFFAVCNIPFYGGTFELCPPACCDDGCLDLVTFSGRGPAATAGFGLAVARGTHAARPDVAIRPVRRVEVRAPQEVAIQIDGDPAEVAPPVVIELSPDALPVLAPVAG